MPLSDAQIRAYRPKDKPFKAADAGGLYLEVAPSGGKLWRLKYRIGGSEKKLALGAYPQVGLSDARKRRDVAREAIAQGRDPALEKRQAKLAGAVAHANTFALVAEEFIANKMEREGKADATLTKARAFLHLLRPAIGDRPISAIKASELLAPLKVMEAAGKHETAKRCRTFAGRVFRYGVATARCEGDPAALLQGALISVKARHHASIIDPGAFGGLLRAIEGYGGSIAVRMALRIAPHVFVRPGELRKAEWSEFDLDAAIWRIPAAKMKARREHAVPLSRQVIGYLEQLAAANGRNGYLFSSGRSSTRPMSENTINAAFRGMGYSNEQQTAHGLRTTASTMLNECGKWNPDAIERALAHGDSDAVRGAYNRGTYWPERVTMMQYWSDHLDILCKGGEILEFSKTAKQR